MRARSAVVASVCAAVVALASAGCTSGQSGTTNASDASPASSAPQQPIGGPALQKTFVDVVNQVRPSVVQITTDRDLGSGVIYDNKGDIVTNAHVVGAAQHFNVRLAGSAAVQPAHLVGAYAPDDLAVIRLDNPPSNLHAAKFGDSARLQVGDIVLAMGNPLGLTGSVTNGIVSAVGREVTEPQGQGSPGATLPDAIQTSASINPGNSGGALVDLEGEVVGIPTLAAVDQQIGGGSAAPGIGFAISSNRVKDIAGQIVAHGHVVNSHRAELGVVPATVVGGGGGPVGAAVVQVAPGSAADKAGIRPGAIITAVNGQQVNSATDLRKLLATLNPGQQITVTLTQPGGGSRTVNVTLGQLPGTP